MIIHLRKSTLFTQSPEKRFAKEYKVEDVIWLEAWLRYRVKGYSIPEVCDYIHIKTGRRPSYNSISRWIVRSEIYSISKEAFKMGAEVVKSEFFGIYEQNVKDELLKHMKSGVSKNSRSIV